MNKTKPFRTSNLKPVRAKIFVYELRAKVYCQNRIYKKILNRDWLSTRLFVT